jgi:hypothetical protein
MAAPPRLVGAPADEIADIAPALSSAIPWDAFSAAGLIGARELQALRRYDGKPEGVQSALLDEVRERFISAACFSGGCWWFRGRAYAAIVDDRVFFCSRRETTTTTTTTSDRKTPTAAKHTH